MAKDENRSVDWTKGLPSNEELPSLSHMLISPILASAFRINRDEPMTEEDVHRESQATLRNLFHQSPNPVFDAFPAYQEQEDQGAYDYRMEGRSNAVELQGKLRVEEQFRGNRDFRGNQREEEDSREEFRGNRRVGEGFREEFGSNRRVEERRHAVADRMDHPGPSKGDVRSNEGQGLQTNTTAREPDPSTPVEHTRPNTDTESPGQSSSPYQMNTLPYGLYQPQAENGSTFEMEDTNSGGGAKRARLVWTPQLHKRFVETVGHLGIKNAVPKTIMQLMNVEGLTRENVASHLQKYRLYLKHMQGDDSLSASDHLFASTPVPMGMVPREGPFTMPVIPMQFQGLVRPGPFQSSGERVPYGPGFMEQPAMVPERTQAAVKEKQGARNNNDQPGSSSQYVLPLFPTN